MDKYQLFINVINNKLIEFSKFLSPEFQIPPFDTGRLTDPCISWNLTEIGYDDRNFPSSDNHGVYFLFGRKEKEEEFLGVYVGKASHSKIGHRLYSHLHKIGRESRLYPMQDKQANVFLIEFVLAIPMDDVYFLAPALEEFMIHELQEDKVYLLNSVGGN